MPRTVTAPTVRGACPGVAAPLEAADGMLLRVRLPGGRISSAGLRALADVATRHGSSVVELTARANVQLRGVAVADVGRAAEALVAAGLVDPDPSGEQRRDVVAGPLAGHDPTELVDVSPLVDQIAELLARSEELDGLPPKFGVVVDGGGRAGVRAVPADLALGAVRVDERDGTDEPAIAFQVELGRSLDDAPAIDTSIDREAILPLVERAARWAATTGDRPASAGERIGRDAMLGRVLDGLGARPAVPSVASTPAPGSPTIAIGRLAHPGPGSINLGGAPWLGRTGPEALRVVAAIAEESGAGVRITPWRGLVLVGLPDDRVAWATNALTAVGLSTDPADPAHLLSACVGRAGCASSPADTAAAAGALLTDPRTSGRRLHLAGCEKRCGAGRVEVLVADEQGRFPRVAPVGAP